jgi:hypothetical protein
VYVKLASKFWFNDYFEAAEFLGKVDRLYHNSPPLSDNEKEDLKESQREYESSESHAFDGIEEFLEHLMSERNKNVT